MKPTQPLKCPYNEFSCAYIDTCGMSVEKSCQECEHYHIKKRHWSEHVTPAVFLSFAIWIALLAIAIIQLIVN